MVTRERVLITVKTYPTLSRTHIELVCTAGLRADGSWVRIYPVPFRLLDHEQKFAKWRWVDLPLKRRQADPRPESFSPADRNDIRIEEEIGLEDGWRERRRLVLEKGKVWTNLSELIAAGKRNEASLATFKPSEITSFKVSPADGTEWDPDKLAAVQARLKQVELFEEERLQEDFKPATKLPFDFSYSFKDDEGRESTLKILDWEIGALYLNCLKRAGGDQQVAVEKVREMYEARFLQKDIHLFLGTSLEWHGRAPNPWMIIGVFAAPHRPQLDLL